MLLCLFVVACNTEHGLIRNVYALCLKHQPRSPGQDELPAANLQLAIMMCISLHLPSFEQQN